MITENQKEQIIRSAEAYMTAKGLSNNKFSTLCGVSSSYLSYMLNRNWNDMPAGKKTIKIEDKYFKRIAEAVGVKLEKNYWGHFNTLNHMTILGALEDARRSRVPMAIDGETGDGKSYTAKEYKRQNPAETFVVTAADDLTAKSFMIELAEAVNVRPLGPTSSIRKNVTGSLKSMANPLLIIDEAENLKDGAWGSIKAIMDSLKNKCGIILIGANDFEQKLHIRARKKQKCFPQVYSRIREGGFVHLLRLTIKDVEKICNESGIKNRKVVQYLFDTCDNMRELSGAVSKLKQEAESQNSEVSYELAQVVVLQKTA